MPHLRSLRGSTVRSGNEVLLDFSAYSQLMRDHDRHYEHIDGIVWVQVGAG